jgi:hypothetical protein
MSALQNLPSTVTVEDLARFHFGNPDAAHDELLKEAMCICRIRPVEEFLKDAKTILVGDKGTGKTGVFELLRDRKLKFIVPSSNRQRFVPINQQLDYRALKDRIVRNIVSKVEDEALKYQVVWELLILYFVLQDVRSHGDLPAQLEKAITGFEETFPLEAQKPGLLDIFFSAKKKVGIKFESSPITGFPSADCYMQFGGDEGSAASAPSANLLRLGQLKNLVNNYLSSKRTRTYVLVDRIDEFLIKEDYDIQRMTLQGLVACERSYRQYHYIRLKLFLRRDLFEQIDLREFGADKVMHDTLWLRWTPEDIRDFISKRILHNYLTILQLPNIQMTLNGEHFYVDAKSNQPVSEPVNAGWSRATKWLRRSTLRLRRFFQHTVFRRAIDRFEGRHTNLTDAISTQIVQSFFPTEVWRADPLSSRRLISVSDFLATHFNLAWGDTTPRIILMFAQSCVDSIINFYKKNPDIAGTQPFPVVTKDMVFAAYEDFKLQLWKTMAAEGKQWRDEIAAFRYNFAELGGASYEQVQDAFPAKTDTELRELLAVLQHLGVIACVNKEFALEQRYYRLPILFRTQAAPEA